MAKIAKRIAANAAKVDRLKKYPIAEAVALAKETATTKFDSSIELHFHLGIDTKKSDQQVRGSLMLPHGTGKTKKVIAFVPANLEKDAKEAGADLIGNEEVINQIKQTGKCDFEVAVATPEVMKNLAAIAKTLGQKGLMPNPKDGTVTTDIKKTIANLKKGMASYKNDDSGNVHLIVGKASFTEKDLLENIQSAIEAIKRAKSDTTKGTFILSTTLSSSMGPGIKLVI